MKPRLIRLKPIGSRTSTKLKGEGADEGKEDAEADREAGGKLRVAQMLCPGGECRAAPGRLRHHRWRQADMDEGCANKLSPASVRKVGASPRWSATLAAIKRPNRLLATFPVM
jgi:hypothetical protein